MGFNLFGPPKTSDIRVGYISTDRGYVQGVTICDANRYAQLNPGTTFIIKNRERIEYKNINEINKLKPVDVFVPAPGQGEPLPDGSEDACGGIQLNKPCGPPKVEFYGGGGVGVKGNPVIGKDGSVLAVHLISGGNGYQYPPIVDIKDDCSNRGGGAVARSGIGETVIQTEVYSAEDEFEEYFPTDVGATTEGYSIKEFCNIESAENKAGYGKRYGPDGKDLGPWNPSLYVTDEEDPIERQIAQFQEYLNALTDPWWFVRKEAPLKVTSDDEDGVSARQKKLNIPANRTVYPVQHPAWGGSLLNHGKVREGTFRDEIFEIYTQGGHGRGLQFTFTEVGGDHTFVIKADDYTDSGIPREITKSIKPNVDYTVVSEGSHKGRESKTGTEQGLLRKGFGGRGREKGLGTSSTIFADLLGTNNDNDDLQILAKTGIFKSVKETEKREGHSNYELIYRLTVPANSSEKNRQVEIARSFMNDHAISPVPMSNAPGSDFAGMLFTMEWEEEFPFPGEYTFKGQCDNKASFYLDGQQLIPDIAKWKDKPSIIKKNLDWEDSDKKGKVYKMRLDLLNLPILKDVTVQEPPQKDSSDVEYEELSSATAKFEGTTRDDLFLVVSGSGTATAEIKLDTNDSWKTAGTAITELRCGPINLSRTKGRKRETLTGTGTFPVGRHKVQIIGANPSAGQPRIADTRVELLDAHGSDTNASLTLKVVSVKPDKRRLKAPAKPKTASAAGIKVQKVFNTVDWMGKANRQLWRTNVVNRGGFINSAGVCPFDTNIELDTNPYAGTHGITWRNVNFPIDGNYIIKVAVDDNVNLRFHGPGGDISIRKEGFINNEGSLPTGTSTYTRYFKKGMYTLDADLEQIPGGRFGFRSDSKGNKIKDKEVSFRVTSAASFANKITIPGLFSVGKGHEGSQLNENLVKGVEVEKEYDVVCTSEQSSNVRLRVRDNGKRLEMEEWTDNDWQDIVCTVTEGQFYGIQGNRCKFKLSETLKGINPMALAVDVEVAYATKTVISAKSWNENPMGVAFTVKAPNPPVPIEEIPKAKGRCPNNPMWTTRFPADTQWYPVRFDKWSEFLNRYSISPVLPLNKPGSAEGGKVFTNTWNVNIPYDGYYQLKGEVDDIARYYIDGDLKLDLTRRKNRIRGSSKFFLTAGLKKLKVEVENYSFVTYQNVSKKVFSGRDWRRQAPVTPVPTSGIICHAGGGAGGTDNEEQRVGGKVIVGQGGDGGSGGDDDMYGKHHGGRGGGAGLRGGGSSTNPMTHKQLDAMGTGKYKGGPGGFGVNFQGNQVGSLQQTVADVEFRGGDGVAMGGGGGGNAAGQRGGFGGSGGVKITWSATGKSQEWTSPGIYNVTVSDDTEVVIVCIGGGGSGFTDTNGDKRGSGGSGGAYAYVNKDIKKGQQLKIVVGKGGGEHNEVRGSHKGGDSYVELVSTPPSNQNKIIKQQKGKVSYQGPNLFHYTDDRWGKVMNKFGISPANVDTNLDKPTPDNVGTKVLEWSNVDFPHKGQYDVLFAADNKASLYINGEQLLFADNNYTLNSDKAYDKINISTPGRYDVKIELINTYDYGASSRTSINEDVFRSNPSGVVLEIRKDVSVAVDRGKPWTKNPVGVSGVLVPPPCPKEVGGKGVVTEVIIDDPGNGFEPPPEDPEEPQYPVVLKLKKVRVTKPGINNNCKTDKVVMVPDLGYKFIPKCGPFGTIEDVEVIPPPVLPNITGTPEIFIQSPTGIDTELKPEFEIVVVPPTIEVEGILQVTDLAGIKQTGYYNGKPYYGAIYYDNGIKYAGWYETAGQPIQIYDTLQESIDATITTPPSAIQRQGSDVTSNDPRLNIPGTPENLT